MLFFFDFQQYQCITLEEMHRELREKLPSMPVTGNKFPSEAGLRDGAVYDGLRKGTFVPCPQCKKANRLDDFAVS